MKKLVFISTMFLCVASIHAQTTKDQSSVIRATPAYAEVLLRKTELLAEAESLADSYTDLAPKMIDLRYEVAALDRSLTKMRAVRSEDAMRLTEALGKLMVRRAALDTELNRLNRSYNADHVEVKRAKKRLEVFDAAIKEIIP